MNFHLILLWNVLVLFAYNICFFNNMQLAFFSIFEGNGNITLLKALKTRYLPVISSSTVFILCSFYLSFLFSRFGYIGNFFSWFIKLLWTWSALLEIIFGIKSWIDSCFFLRLKVSTCASIAFWFSPCFLIVFSCF